MKIAEIVLGLIIFPLCITYNEKGGIYVTNTTRSLNFTVKYPFEYNNETIVFTGEDNPVGNFNFDPAIEACVKLFVGVSVVTCFAAVTTLIVGCVVHRNEDKANKVLIAEIFVALLMAFLLVISTSLWLYNLLELRKEVEDEIVSIITSLGRDQCRNCVEFLPSYSALFASVSLAYISFLIWLCNTVMVFLETLHHSAAVITDTSSLVITQELTNKSHETEEQTSAT